MIKFDKNGKNSVRYKIFIEKVEFGNSTLTKERRR